MGINFDTGYATAIYKQRYTDSKIETIAFKSALLAMMPKDPNYGGSNFVGAIRIAVTTARSALPTTAYTAGSPSTYERWTCAWENDYASANITGQVIDQARGNSNAMVDALVSEFDGAFIALGQSLGAALFENGGGAIGIVSAGSNVGSATITLSNISNVVNFQVGQILQAATDDGSASPGAGVLSGTVTLTGVNVNTGTLTVATTWSGGIASIAAGNYLFNQGDYGAKVIGLAGWLPNTDPGNSDSFNGVNRSVDPARLAGARYTGNGAPYSESITELLALVNRIGGHPDKMFCNPLDYANIVKELGSRVIYTTETAFNNPQIGFRGIEYATPFGVMNILQDPYCPQGQAYALQMDTWLLPSMGKVPKVAGEDVDGLDWLRVPNDDAYQARFCYRATSYCKAPGWNGVVIW